MAKNLRLMTAFWAVECGHVFDQSKDRRTQGREHIKRFARIEQSHVLRRTYDDSAGQLGLLTWGELDVAGARWQIDDQNIELSPFDLP